jgi:NTE family protein
MDSVAPKPIPDGSSLAPQIAAFDRVALVLQGGGALGAYQAGVYNALSEAGCEPQWLAGVSIGAINASILAGNKPENRLDKLRGFWETISGRRVWMFTPEGDYFRSLRNQVSAWMTMSMGQPGFFEPRRPGPWHHPPGASGSTSHYDTSKLRDTLLEFVDFDLINNGDTRLSVGAVNVRTGNFVYFDNAQVKIGPEHIMASGALPPAFPAIKIEGDYYWDGGIVSNTPLQYLLDQDDHLSSLVFQVDLFSAAGTLPRDMRDVLARHKDIMYSSRTRYNTDVFQRMRAFERRLARAIEKIPPELRSAEDEAVLKDIERSAGVTIIHLIYQQRQYENQAKDYEFSGTSMREHWESGFEDTKRTLRRRDWFVPPADGAGVAIHDLHHDDNR